MARIAFIGLGNMGRPMARNLVKAGHAVTGFDLKDDLRAAAAADGVTTTGSIAEAVAGAEVVVTMLPAGAAVRAVYQGDGGVLASADGSPLLIDSSTIDVDTARAVAAAAGEAGFAMLDAPVSGGVGGADAGTLTFMVGGREAAVEQARPILEAMGRTIVRAGEAGAGQAAKICNNMMLGIQMLSVCEAFALADRLGLDRQKLFDVSSKASGQCWSLTTYCPVPGPVETSPANRDYAPGFTAAMMLKDLRLAQQAAAAAEAATPLGAEAAALYALYCNDGHGDADFSGIFRMIASKQ
ncbi:MAG: 3-hydroxyisobutyrate dehydrogenase [Alphaproteobacteria bacterium]|jgi:3-hydroxyisobutyrate dehydrogenase|nr:3-hydroxyisobutyrate dehydrogenase [Alphaproteobacteria bacterium]